MRGAAFIASPFSGTSRDQRSSLPRLGSLECSRSCPKPFGGRRARRVRRLDRIASRAAQLAAAPVDGRGSIGPTCSIIGRPPRGEPHDVRPTGGRGTTIRPERPEDASRVRHVNEVAFGRPVEADLVERLQQACTDSLSLVAEDDAVVGHILSLHRCCSRARGDESSGWDWPRRPCSRAASGRA